MYTSIFIKTQENTKLELYTDTFGEFSFTELKDSVAKNLVLSDTSSEDLQHEKHGPKNIKTYRKLAIGRSQTDGNFFIKFRLCSAIVARF